MNLEPDEIEDLDLPDEGAEGASVDEAASQDAGAQSSSAQGDNEASTLSLVRNVVEESEQAAAASPAEGVETGRTGDDGKTGTDADSYADVPFRAHPRFRQLIGERNDLRHELKRAEVDADRYRNVESFMQANNVTAEEAAEALTLVARAKVDPAGTLEALKPLITDLLQRSGEVLPADLQQAVREGRYSADAATEISRLRASQEMSAANHRLREQQTQQRQQHEVATGIQSAVIAWETDRRQKDPNFEAKIAPLQREIAFLHATEGKPATAQAAQEQLARAYKAVNANILKVGQPQQRKQAIRPVTGGQMNGSARPAPKSTLDIIRQHTGGAL